MPDFGIMRGFGEKLFGDKLVAGQLPTQLGNNLDPNAVAFFNRVIDAGGTLSATEQLAVNQLVIDMKAYGIWSAMKAIYPMVGASAAACAQNLKSSSFTGTFSSGWTFASTGATPNGTSAFMNSFFIPSTNWTTTSQHASFYSRSNTLGGYNWGAYGLGGSETALIARYSNGSAYIGLNTAGLTSGTNSNGSGFYVAKRTTNNLATLFKNNNLLLSNTITSSIGVPHPLYLAAANNGVSARDFDNKQCAFASIGDGLDDTQASNFYTAVQAFQTTLSRQV